MLNAKSGCNGNQANSSTNHVNRNRTIPRRKQPNNHSLVCKQFQATNSNKMFGGMMQEQPEPTAADVGKFLSEEELLAWHATMEQKYPQIFTADDKLFGTDGKRHPMGTKLMAFFDEDRSKPMRVEVQGSRWKIEYGDKSLVYIVRFKDQTELSQIELTSAHEESGWTVGWDKK